MRRPPHAWTFSIHTPLDAAARHAPATGVRYVVKLEIEEDLEPEPVQLFQNCGTGGGEQLAADLDPATRRIDSLSHRERLVRRRVVERDQDSRAACANLAIFRRHSPSTPWIGLIEVQCLQLGHCQCSELGGKTAVPALVHRPLEQQLPGQPLEDLEMPAHFAGVAMFFDLEIDQAVEATHGCALAQPLGNESNRLAATGGMDA